MATMCELAGQLTECVVVLLTTRQFDLLPLLLCIAVYLNMFCIDTTCNCSCVQSVRCGQRRFYLQRRSSTSE